MPAPMRCAPSRRPACIRPIAGCCRRKKRLHRAGRQGRAVVVLSFESADHPVDAWMKRALELAAEHGGSWDAEALSDKGSHRAGAAGEWREKFVRMPYFSEHMVARGIAATTFESAITWDRFKDFHSNVMDATRKAIKRVTGREGSLTCRFTHLYPDGRRPTSPSPAPWTRRRCSINSGHQACGAAGAGG